MASTVDSDAKPGVLSGRVQMESHPHLSLKRKKMGRHQANKGSPYRQVQGQHKEGCRAYQ